MKSMTAFIRFVTKRQKQNEQLTNSDAQKTDMTIKG